MSPVDPKRLPIRDYAQKILEAVRSNPVTIVIGETGSGKTTQISQVCAVHTNHRLLLVVTLLYAEAHADRVFDLVLDADFGGSWLC